MTRCKSLPGIRTRWSSLSPYIVSSVVFAAHYYASAKGLFSRLLETASSSLPDGSPSGATVVNADDLTCGVAFEWWHPSVVIERFAQLASGGAPAKGSDSDTGPKAAPIGEGHRRLPPRLDALLDVAARRVLGKRPGSSADCPGLVFVFSHGGDGNVLSVKRNCSALQIKDRLQVRRGSAGGRRPSVLAAYIDGFCVTECIGRIAVLPPPDSAAGPQKSGREIVAYLVSRGFDSRAIGRASKVSIAPRGGGPPVEYALTRE